MKKYILVFITLLLFLMIGIHATISMRPLLFQALPEQYQSYDYFQNRIYIDAIITSVNNSSLHIKKTSTIKSEVSNEEASDTAFANKITSVPIRENTVIIDSTGRKMSLSQLTAGQRLQLWVSDGVVQQVIEKRVDETTYEEVSLTSYNDCYEIKVLVKHFVDSVPN